MRKIRDNYSCIQALAAVFCFTVLITQCDLIWGQEKTNEPSEKKQPAAAAGDKTAETSSASQKKPKLAKAQWPLAPLLAMALERNPDIGVAISQVREAEAQLNRTRLTVVQQVMELRQSWETESELLRHAQQLIGTRRDAYNRVEKLYEQGAASSAEESSAKGLLNQAEIDSIKQQAKLAEIDAKLSYLLGLQPLIESGDGSGNRLTIQA